MTIAEKLQLIARNVQKVFDKGFTDGKQSEYDAFWDAFQQPQNDVRTGYGYAFAGTNWSEEIFKPKHNIIAGWSCNYMFGNSKFTNLKETLSKCGITMDLSRATGLYAAFISMTANEALPEINASDCTNMQNCFSTCMKLKTIDKIVVSEKLTNINNAFQGCTALENVIFDKALDCSGLACSGLDMSSCKKLTVESIRSVLKVLSLDVSGKSVTFATVHQTIIESDAECIRYATAAKNVGWTIAYN